VSKRLWARTDGGDRQPLKCVERQLRKERRSIASSLLARLHKGLTGSLDISAYEIRWKNSGGEGGETGGLRWGEKLTRQGEICLSKEATVSLYFQLGELGRGIGIVGGLNQAAYQSKGGKGRFLGYCSAET